MMYNMEIAIIKQTPRMFLRWTRQGKLKVAYCIGVRYTAILDAILIYYPPSCYEFIFEVAKLREYVKL